MVTTVTLQPPFEYYWWVILIAAILAAAAIAIVLYVLNKYFHIFSKLFSKPKSQIKTPPSKLLYQIKEDYIGQLQQLSLAYGSKSMDKRTAYQRLSLLIRGFVKEATGINVENYTKAEIKAFGIRHLDNLMEEYYVPEFAEEERASGRDFVNSCNIALGVIRTWS